MAASAPPPPPQTAAANGRRERLRKGGARGDGGGGGGGRGEGGRRKVRMKGGRFELGSAVVRTFTQRKGSAGGGGGGEEVESKRSLPGLRAYGGGDSPLLAKQKRDAAVARVVARANGLRRLAARYQRRGRLGLAGEKFQQAIDARPRGGLHCTRENGDAHVEYAQNLSKRGLIAEAEYHLRTSADIYRQLRGTRMRKYADVLLYTAVIVDRQDGRLPEAEAFYRAALAVYRACKLGDDNVRVAINNLINNLRTQGKDEEVEMLVNNHFNGAGAPLPGRRPRK